MILATNGWTIPYNNNIKGLDCGLKRSVTAHTLMTKALRNAAGIRSLYLFATRQPPIMVEALLAIVN